MELSTLMALSPLDGRYAYQVTDLRTLFSEFGLIKHRLIVEIRWFQVLANLSHITEIKPLSPEATHYLNRLIQDFDLEAAKKIKIIEQTINHDVKAVEHYLRGCFSIQTELMPYQEFIHFACTSEDINNLAYALMLTAARTKVVMPLGNQLLAQLKQMAKQYASLPMLGRTHGQSATPTTLGKEIANFAARLDTQLQQFQCLKIRGKMNGAVGNFNAHRIAYPEVNWPQISKDFIHSLMLGDNPYTTQIEPHDYIAELVTNLSRINTVLLDLCRDFWGYISLDYFKQNPQAQDVGSSTMPHKVNPIDFENAEGNLGLANALCCHFAMKLPVSRWQRDLSDSTLLRNLGVVFAHSVIAYQAILKGLNKITANPDILTADLEQHWEILGEAIQTMMRRYGLSTPYEQLKQLTRGKSVNARILHDFINQLDLPASAKQQLLALTPAQYVGFAEQLAQNV